MIDSTSRHCRSHEGGGSLAQKIKLYTAYFDEKTSTQILVATSLLNPQTGSKTNVQSTDECRSRSILQQHNPEAG